MDREIKIIENEALDSYIKEFNEDVKLTQYNIREKSMTTSSIWSKWISYLFKERENLQRSNDIKLKIVKSKMQNVKATDSIIRLKSEEKVSENDETMKKLNALIKRTQTNIDFIEHALNVMQNFGFTVKNAIESLKLTLEH